MPQYSIFNDVLGPVMIGPSSSHTAGPNRIGRLVRAMLGAPPVAIRIVFDPHGSLAYTYRGQKADCGFVGGLMGLGADDPALPRAVRRAREAGIRVEFGVEPIPGADHPNAAVITATAADGRSVEAVGVSTGGGMMVIQAVDGVPVRLTGGRTEVLVRLDAGSDAQAERAAATLRRLTTAGLPAAAARPPVSIGRSDRAVLVHASLAGPLGRADLARLEGLPGVRWARQLEPVLPVPDRPEHGPLFVSAREMVAYAEANGLSLGRAALAYEARRAGWDPERTRDAMRRILAVMRDAARKGLEGTLVPAGGLVKPTARRLDAAGRQGRLLGGNPLARGVTLAIAVMEVSNSMGVICAAPTAGSCGVLPGVLLSAQEAHGFSDEAVVDALFAAGGVGLIIGRRATFAAELAGCQAECGAASAMAAAALVELAGGSPAQAEGAASVALQNTLGLICDPVAGLVEVPCFGKNALGVGNAYAAADMILGGYDALIPFDEVADAMKQVGEMMPREIRCTALGGVAATPTGIRLQERYLARVKAEFDLD